MIAEASGVDRASGGSVREGSGPAAHLRRSLDKEARVPAVVPESVSRAKAHAEERPLESFKSVTQARACGGGEQYLISLSLSHHTFLRSSPLVDVKGNGARRN
jgi:hypothetical protein